jgi:hypothetical protein
MITRRSLVQSAAALLVPSTAATAVMASTVNPELERAVETYFRTFRAFYGKPYLPDDDSPEAHERADDELEKRKDAFEAARDALIDHVKRHHRLDPDNDCVPLATVTLDVGELTLAVTPRQELDCEPCGTPLGIETLALIPRTAAMRARLNALPTFDPYEFDSEEDAERLGLKHEPYPPEFDLSRMPADEPIPTSVSISGPYESGNVTIYRHWKAEDAWACQRCDLCPFIGSPVEDLGREPVCAVTVKQEDADRVLHGPTPPDKEVKPPGGLMVDTWFEWDERGVVGEKTSRLDVLVMTRAAWEADPRSKRPEWAIAEGPRGTRGKLVVVGRKLTGPQPRILAAAQVAAESTA